MAFFDSIELLPDDPILQLPILFNAETHPHKVNLGVGNYRDANGKPLVLTAVKSAEEQILKQALPKDYLPIEGPRDYLQACKRLLFGEGSPFVDSDAVFSFQSIGGTGALSVGGSLLMKLPVHTIYISKPSWPNHQGVFTSCGFDVKEYPYFCNETHGFDFKGMCAAISRMEPGAVILLHASCHNPTGSDPTQDQWRELSRLIKERGLIPFMDIAYQGFGDGLEQDAWSVRYFAEQGHQMLVAMSFSKNLGLYGERVGFGCVITSDAGTAQRVGSQIKRIIRRHYSNPALHGARIVTAILTSDSLRKEWTDELADMRLRIQQMRIALHADLLVKGVKRDIEYVRKQKGMFSFLGLTPQHVEVLKKDYGIYVPNDGRINVAGLTSPNLDYVCKALAAVMET